VSSSHLPYLSSSQELEELSHTDKRQQLEMQTAEFEHLCATIEQTRGRLEGLPSVHIQPCTVKPVLKDTLARTLDQGPTYIMLPLLRNEDS